MDIIFNFLLFFGLSGISAVFPVIRVFPVNLGTLSCHLFSKLIWSNFFNSFRRLSQCLMVWIQMRTDVLSKLFTFRLSDSRWQKWPLERKEIRFKMLSYIVQDLKWMNSSIQKIIWSSTLDYCNYHICYHLSATLCWFNPGRQKIVPKHDWKVVNWDVKHQNKQNICYHGRLRWTHVVLQEPSLLTYTKQRSRC